MTQQPQRPAARTNRMTFNAIRKNLGHGPDKVVLYGTEGVGKTSMAAAAPAPIFIPAEDGIRNLVPVPDSFPAPETFQDVLDAVGTLLTEPHDYKTLVVDTIDAVDALIKDAVCKKFGWTSEDFDAYGRGYKCTPDEHRRLITALDRLGTERGMNVWVIGHAKAKQFKNPMGADYLRYQPILMGDDATNLWKAWPDALLFATYETTVFVGQQGNDPKMLKRGKAQATGNRVVHTEWAAAFDAKNRYSLPAVLPLDYAEYAAAREAGRVASPEKLHAEALALLAAWAPSPEDKVKAENAIEQAKGDAGKLAKIIDRLRFKVAEKEETK